MKLLTRLALVTAVNLALAVKCMAQQPLVVHFVAESGFSVGNQSDCLSSQFETNTATEDALVQWAASEADSHSKLLFSKPGLIRVQSGVLRFTLSQLSNELNLMKQEASGRAEVAQLNDDIEMVTSIVEQDARLMRIVREECRKAEQTHLTDRAAWFWVREAVRRSRYSDFGTAVDRAMRHLRNLPGERNAIVLLTPYQYTDINQKMAGALISIFAGSVLPKDFQGIGEISGYMQPQASEGRRSKNDPVRLQNRRGIVSVGGYAVVRTADVHQTYVHEMAHYVGLAHTDSSDDSMYLTFQFSNFEATFASADEDGRRTLCEMPFPPKGTATYRDNDGAGAKVNDTSLSFQGGIPGEGKPYHDECWRISPNYKKHFGQADNAAKNVMAYYGSSDNPDEYYGVTPGQATLMLEMLSTFQP